MKSIASRFSSIAGTVPMALMAATTLVVMPVARAQSTAPQTASATPASATAPAKVVDQLLRQVEKEFVPLADAMPADKYNFVPTNGNFKGVRSFADQVKHVIRANYFMFGAAASIKPTNMPNMQDLKTKGQIVQALRNSFTFAHHATATLTNDNALEAIKPVDGISTRAGLMLFAIVHMNDHFGQLVVYLRMNGIVPPSSRPH